MMRRWIGRSLIGIGLIHVLLGGFLYAEPLQDIVNAGIWNSLELEPLRHLAFWFLVDGFWVILLGLVVDWSEQKMGGDLSLIHI